MIPHFFFPHLAHAVVFSTHLRFLGWKIPQILYFRAKSANISTATARKTFTSSPRNSRRKASNKASSLSLSRTQTKLLPFSALYFSFILKSVEIYLKFKFLSRGEHSKRHFTLLFSQNFSLFFGFFA